MRLMVIILVIGAGLWGGYWFVGSNAAQSGFEAWFEDRRAEGWVAEYDDLQVKGFPSRFDAGFDDVRLADPDTGLAWSAPFFQINALSYKPNHVIAVWPDTQRIATPRTKYDIASDDMRASLKVAPQTDLALQRLSLTADTVSVTETGASKPTRLETLSLAVEQVAEEFAPRYRLGLSVEGLSLGPDWKRRIDPDDHLPDTLKEVRVDMTTLFDKTWDITAIEDTRPQPREIAIKSAKATWGKLSLAMAGDVTIDASGTPTGEVMVKARNWRDILALARASGAVSETLAGSLENALGLLSQMAGNPNTLDIPLDLRAGRVWLGPVPIAEAPVLRLR